MSSYPPPPPFFPPSSTTVPFIRNPYQMNYHHAPPPLYYPYPPHFDGSVNMNNPYIYDPTHVKHRRRTTPEQLKVLEETFKTDPKPNHALRKQLSLRLGMTPRVLQVWFQNRRMKVKRLVKKQTDQNSNSFAETVSAATSAIAEGHQRDGLLSSPGSPSNTTPGPEISSAPASASTPTPPSGSPSSSPAPSPSSPSSYPDPTRRSSLPLVFGFNPSSNHHLPFHNFHQPQQQHLPLNHHQHQNMPWNNNANNNNNGSATAIRYDATSNSSTGGNGSTFDSLTDPLLPRRRSFTSLRRLDSHPFAPLVAAGNGVAVTLPTRQNHLFPIDSLSTSAITANAESLSDIGACASLPDPSSANNTSCASATVSMFLPLSTGGSTDVSCKTTEGMVTGRPTSLKSEDLNTQGFVQRHSKDYRRSSSADGSNIFRSAALPDSDSKENRLDRSRTTAEATLESPAEPEHINRQGHRLPGPPPTADVRSPGSLTLQQRTLPQQRSHSPSQVRTFLKNYHSSSTPTYVTGQAQGSSIMSSMSNNSAHTITHTPIGVVQPGRSASFHGIIPNSDNYHAYYNRQIPAGQGVSVGVGRDIGIQKGSGVEYGYQSLSVNYPARGLYSSPNVLQPQVMQAGNRGYLHSGYRSMSSASLLGHSNSLQETGPPTQDPQPYQHSHHHGSLPFHPQFRQPESEPANTQSQPPYTFPPRQLGFLLPGPLPAADYSFGTATSNTDSEMRETDEETQDDKQVHTWDSVKGNSDITLNNTAGSISNTSGTHDDKGYESRFGSLASLASMPSVPSVSEGGTSAEWEWEFEGLRDMGDERRGSCTGQVAKLLSTLEVGSRRGSEESIHSLHSGRLLNVPDGMSTHFNHRHDLNEIQQLSYPVPNVDLRRDPEATVDGNKNEGTTGTTGHADGGFNEKVNANEQVDDEDQRKTPSASPPMTRSQETKKTYQEMNLYSKGIHGDQILSAYSPLHPGSTHCPASGFYNINVGVENGYDITNQLGVPRDIPVHGSMSIGMNMDMVEIEEPFPFTNASGDYVSGGANAEDGMFGIERYTEATTTSGGPYDGVY